MGAISSLSPAVDALKRNPVLIVAGLVIALVNVGVLAATTLAPATAGLVMGPASLVVQLVAIFFVGGAYAMADESLDGRTRLGTLVSAGKEHYVTLLGATLLFVAVSAAVFTFVGIVAVVVVIAVGIGFGSMGGIGAGGGGLAVLGGLALVFLALYLLGFVAMLFLQFYAPAVVVSGEGAIDALKRSYAVVRHNLLSTLGFDAIIATVMLVGSAPTIWLYGTWWAESVATLEESSATAPEMVTPFAGLDATTVGAYLLVTLVLTSLTGAFFYVYQVAFYEDRVAETAFGDGSSTASESRSEPSDRDSDADLV